MSIKKRVVITGMGVVAGDHTNVDDFWNDVYKGESFVKKINLDNPNILCKIGATVNNFEIDDSLLKRKEQKRTDKTIHWALHSVNQAKNQSGLDKIEMNMFRVGNLVGTGFGGFMSLVKHHKKYTMDKKISSFPAYSVTQSLNNMIPAYISIKNNLKGVSYSISSACASSAHAFEVAFNEIQNGTHDVIYCTGVESTINDVGILNFVNLRALTCEFNEDPKKASRPFDKDRSGFVMGEGSATLVLEEYEHAKKRGAKILAEVVSTASTSDAKYLVAPDESSEPIIECMNLALKKGNLKPEDIDYLNAHATSTIIGDQFESKGIENIFKNNKKLSISATKSITGHLLGGAGALELLISIMAMNTGKIPPTLNLEKADKDCNLDYTANKFKEKEINYVLKNSFGFGGTNCSIILKKFKEYK